MADSQNASSRQAGWQPILQGQNEPLDGIRGLALIFVLMAHMMPGTE
ncbi:hypothetical protein HZA57_03575, partial [Candidatus Poribacteria bacterium]|nr:hypothetical protein [Candidatus Poribacteria bacterium]